MTRILSTFTLALIVCGCNTSRSRLSPITSGTQFKGVPANELTLNVKSSIIWLYSAPPNYEELCRLPYGRYEVEGMDRTFIYFKCPRDVTYSMRTSIRSADTLRKRGPGGIYLRIKGKSEMLSNVGVYLRNGDYVERILEGYDSFLDERGTSWSLEPKTP